MTTETPERRVERVLAEERVVYFPVKHYSPACAWQVRKLIRELRPAAVLVEAPDDASELIPFVVDGDTRPPVTILSSYADRKNRYGLNGLLSPAADVPVRYRAWWPLVAFGPEYAALAAGAEVGAELAFIDAPLAATIPHHHVPKAVHQRLVSDVELAESAYFARLGQRQRRRSFEEFWQANFEAGGWRAPTRDFMRAVLLFGACARQLAEIHPEVMEADGTLLREAHMRWWIDRFAKELPDGQLVVVTGAFHSVGLVDTKKRRAKLRADKNTETLLTSHSFRALSRLYDMSRLPAYGQLVWEGMQEGRPQPYNDAAMELAVRVMRSARDAGVVVSSADALEAYRAARNLATLRENRETTLDDLRDAIRMTYVKGDVRIGAPAIDKATEEVLVGSVIGKVTAEAGRVPLMRDFYARCKALRLDVSGAKKVVRCDVHKHQKHRLKSAFLHRCDFLGVPMFQRIDEREGRWASHAHYKGPDLASGENLHLIGETWGVRWQEEVDDRLVELSDRGATIEQAAATLIDELVPKAKGDAAATTKLLLRCAQMLLTDRLERLLTAVEEAIESDASLEHLADALADFVLLHSYRDAVATRGHARLLDTIRTVFTRACLILPGIAATSEERTAAVLDRLQTLVRIAITFEAVPLDRELLIDKVRDMVVDIDGAPGIRGAGFGILFSFGATREKVVARELDGYLLGSRERVLQAGVFLDGLLLASKTIFMGSKRLLRAMNRVLGELDWETFKLLLPDLRRAFTQFIPTEIDAISARVSEELGLAPPPDPNQPVPPELVRLATRSDARVRAILEQWDA